GGRDRTWGAVHCLHPFVPSAEDGGLWRVRQGAAGIEVARSGNIARDRCALGVMTTQSADKCGEIYVGGVCVQLLAEGDAIVRMMRNNKIWEPQTRAAWGGLVRPGDVVVDVGAY